MDAPWQVAMEEIIEAHHAELEEQVKLTEVAERARSTSNKGGHEAGKAGGTHSLMGCAKCSKGGVAWMKVLQEAEHRMPKLISFGGRCCTISHTDGRII